MDRLKRIEKNFMAVRDEINQAAQKTSRRFENIKIVVASKYISSLEELAFINSLGIEALGENRQQDLSAKRDLLLSAGVNATWHFIGHLQSNKARKIVRVAELIQSVDSLKIAEKINKYAAEAEKQQRILLQLKLTDEPPKTGILPNKIDIICRKIAKMPNIKIDGLMAIAPHAATEEIRTLFKKARNTLINLQSLYNIGDILSLGMTNDYIVAIEEGSNMVRIGSAIWR